VTSGVNPSSGRSDRFEEGTSLRRIRTSLEDTAWLLSGIGKFMVNASGRAFRNRGWPGAPWPQRINPNWPGIISDFAKKGASAGIPFRRFEPQPVLHDTGRLAGSVSWRPVAKDVIEVGSSLPYAGALHAGQPTWTEPIKPGFRAWLWKRLKPMLKTLKRINAGKKTVTSAREAKMLRARLKASATYQRLVARKALLDTWRKAARAAGKSLSKKDQNALNNVRTQMNILKRKAMKGIGKSVKPTAKESSSFARAKTQGSGAEAIRWLLNPHLVGQRFKIKHPARPIVKVDDQVRGEVERLLGARIRVLP